MVLGAPGGALAEVVEDPFPALFVPPVLPLPAPLVSLDPLLLTPGKEAPTFPPPVVPLTLEGLFGFPFPPVPVLPPLPAEVPLSPSPTVAVAVPLLPGLFA